MVSGVKQHILDRINSILFRQMDIASALERFLVESSKSPAFNGTVRYFENGLPGYQCGINIIHQKFELQQDNNSSKNFSQLNFHMDITN